MPTKWPQRPSVEFLECTWWVAGTRNKRGVAKACDGQGSEPRGASQQDWGLEGAPGRTVRTDLGGSLGGKRSSPGPRTGRVRAE